MEGRGEEQGQVASGEEPREHNDYSYPLEPSATWPFLFCREKKQRRPAARGTNRIRVSFKKRRSHVEAL